MTSASTGLPMPRKWQTLGILRKRKGPKRGSTERSQRAERVGCEGESAELTDKSWPKPIAPAARLTCELRRARNR